MNEIELKFDGTIISLWRLHLNNGSEATTSFIFTFCIYVKCVYTNTYVYVNIRALKPQATVALSPINIQMFLVYIPDNGCTTICGGSSIRECILRIRRICGGGGGGGGDDDTIRQATTVATISH